MDADFVKGLNFDELPKFFMDNRPPMMDHDGSRLFYNGKEIRGFETAVGIKLLEGKYDKVYFKINKIVIDPQGFDGGVDLSLDYEILQNIKKTEIDKQEFESLAMRIIMKILVLGKFVEDAGYAEVDAKLTEKENKEAFAEMIGEHKSHLDAFGFKNEYWLVDYDNNGKGFRDTVVGTLNALAGGPTESLVKAEKKLFK